MCDGMGVPVTDALRTHLFVSEGFYRWKRVVAPQPKACAFGFCYAPHTCVWNHAPRRSGLTWQASALGWLPALEDLNDPDTLSFS